MEVRREKKFVCMRFRGPHSIAFCFIRIGRRYIDKIQRRDRSHPDLERRRERDHGRGYC